MLFILPIQIHLIQLLRKVCPSLYLVCADSSATAHCIFYQNPQLLDLLFIFTRNFKMIHFHFSQGNILTLSQVKLIPSRTHIFRVIAVNRVGQSEPSDPSSPCIAPGAPPAYSPTNATLSVIDSSTLQLAWDVSLVVTGFSSLKERIFSY